MKTTVEIPDSLFREAKASAARQGIPLRLLFERGLVMAIRGGAPAGRRFRLRTVTTKGKGLAVDGDWETIRSMIYEGRGG